jgi:hypothetical protein
VAAARSTRRPRRQAIRRSEIYAGPVTSDRLLPQGRGCRTAAPQALTANICGVHADIRCSALDCRAERVAIDPRALRVQPTTQSRE